MKITRDNYESFFIDYLDNNLEDSHMNDFQEFLHKNPDLKCELEVMMNFSLEPENMIFRGKTDLYKEKYSLENEFNRAAVAWLEGDLTEQEKTEFESYLTDHPDRKKDIALFEKTKLLPDRAVICNIKNKLYRATAVRTITITIIRIAAVLLPALLIFRFADHLYMTDRHSETQITAITAEDNTRIESPASEMNPADTGKTGNQTVQYNQQLASAEKPRLTEKQEAGQKNNENEITEREKIILHRIPAKDPDKLILHNASAIAEPAVISVNIATIKPDTGKKFREEIFLADIVKEKTGIDEISLNKIARTGLTLVSKLSDKKFLYETDRQGNITEISFESRLLAFTIPTSGE